MLGAGLGVSSRNEPLGSSQGYFAPAGHAGFADSSTVGEHHQGQHGIGRGRLECLGQLLHQLGQMHTTQAGSLWGDSCLGEVTEAHPGQRIAVDHVQLKGLAEGGQQHAEHLP
ncbi:hypothetical protein D3C79_874110 [compost metagenome]